MAQKGIFSCTKVYTVLFLVSIVSICYYRMGFMLETSFNFGLFYDMITANKAVMFMFVSIVMSMISTLIYINHDRLVHGVKFAWIALILTVVFTPAVGFPFYMFLRSRVICE